MRELLWMHLRKSRVLRRLYSVPLLQWPMRVASSLLVPGSRFRLIRVQNGPGAGLLLRVYPRWQAALWEGDYEPVVQEALRSVLRPGSVFFDVGASTGFYSMVAARWGARVLALEADPAVALELQGHIELNGLADLIHIRRMAAYSHTGSVFFNAEVYADGRRNGSVSAQADSSSQQTEVPCVTLDECSKENLVPDVIKIDVEGGEVEVLKGAERLFTERRPLLICEVHHAANARWIASWLSSKRYRVQWLTDCDRYPCELAAFPEQAAARDGLHSPGLPPNAEVPGDT